ncbi:hypothetical protein ACFWIW_28125 [Amycolatopsis sp. NPDC058340]|uniref:hypothetical protein n=1 Tax=Amycolatopsis sp. NPDC058340 TaxID=3346453 RepID=UPI0036687272
MTGDEGDVERSVRVVLFRRDSAGAISPMWSDGSEELLDSAAVLVAPENVPRQVVHALLEREVPSEFAADPWLNKHRTLIFDDNRCEIGGYTLAYHDQFGVYAIEET